MKRPRTGTESLAMRGTHNISIADLHLILDARVGLFLSYNSAGKSGTRAREAVRHAFLDRYFPYEPAPVSAVDGARDAQLVSGRYIISRRSETTILKVLTLLGESKVFTNADATISLDDLKDPNGQPKNSPGPAVPIGTR